MTAFNPVNMFPPGNGMMFLDREVIVLSRDAWVGRATKWVRPDSFKRKCTRANAVFSCKNT